MVNDSIFFFCIGLSTGSFSKENLSQTNFPFRFCKIGLKSTIFGRKWSFIVCFVCCLLQLCPILAYLKKLKHSSMKWFVVRFGNCSTPKVLIFCRCTGFTKMQLAELLDRRSVLDKLFQNEVQSVLYFISWCWSQLTYSLDHSRRIYSPLNFRFIQKSKWWQMALFFFFAQLMKRDLNFMRNLKLAHILVVWWHRLF